MEAASPTDRVPFPHTLEDFNNDVRVSFSQLDNCWMLEEEDGSQWEFNEVMKKWMPMLDEALRQQQSAAYAVEGVDEEESVQPQKKRKGENGTGQSSKKPKKENPQTVRKNASVFVTNIPLDATLDEIIERFAKFGILAESLDTGEKRVKMYMDNDGKFKGEALVTYFRDESVPLAITMLHEDHFRLGQEDPSGRRMSVVKADFSHRTPADGNGAPKPRNERDKARAKKKYEKLNSKLADWDDDDPSVVEPRVTKWDKTVIMKHMFRLTELADDPTLLLDIPQEIEDECKKYGDVTTVIMYDKEEDGVVAVRFSTVEAAHACAKATNGRAYGGLTVKAYVSQGPERFKKSARGDEAEDQARLERFGESL